MKYPVAAYGVASHVGVDQPLQDASMVDSFGDIVIESQFAPNCTHASRSSSGVRRQIPPWGTANFSALVESRFACNLTPGSIMMRIHTACRIPTRSVQQNEPSSNRMLTKTHNERPARVTSGRCTRAYTSVYARAQESFN